MKLIVGLGNPGRKYEKTRHNAGKLALKMLAKKIGKSFKGEVVLVEPRSYMNLSGPEVAAVMRTSGVETPENLLILVDDIHLPFGKIRFRSGGSDGGHNGLTSLIESLGTQAFPRIRIGVGKPKSQLEDWKEYVLEKFTSEEEKNLPGIFEKVTDCALSWLNGSPEKVMQKFNG